MFPKKKNYKYDSTKKIASIIMIQIITAKYV